MPLLNEGEISGRSEGVKRTCNCLSPVANTQTLEMKLFRAFPLKTRIKENISCIDNCWMTFHSEEQNDC